MCLYIEKSYIPEMLKQDIKEAKQHSHNMAKEMNLVDQNEELEEDDNVFEISDDSNSDEDNDKVSFS